MGIMGKKWKLLFRAIYKDITPKREKQVGNRIEHEMESGGIDVGVILGPKPELNPKPSDSHTDLCRQNLFFFVIRNPWRPHLLVTRCLPRLGKNVTRH